MKFAKSIRRTLYAFLVPATLLISSTTNAQNNALDFDGTGDYVNVPDAAALDLTNTWTLEAWVYLDVTGVQHGIIEKYDNIASTGGYILRINSSNQVYVSTVNGTTGSFVTSTTTLSASTWYHVAGTFNSATNTISVYVNGQLESSNTSATLASIAGNTDLRLGARGNDLAEELDGQLDEVRIWNDVRTEEELALNMNHELSGSESGLVAYYDFNQGTAGGSNGAFTSLPDASTNSNTGTVTNFALTGSSSNYVSGFSPINNALDFDGTNDYVDLGDLALTSGTVSMWIYADALPDNQRIYAQPTGATTQAGSLGIDPNNTADFDIFVWSGSAWLKLVDESSDWSGAWHHLAVVYSGGTATAYWDGTEQLTQTANFDFNGVSFGLGSVYTGPNGTYWDGAFDEVQIWNTARTCSEILSTKDVELTGSETGLVAYYNFNHGVAGGTNTGLTTLPDLSGNNNDGTLTNFALSSTSSNYLDGSGNSVSGNTPVNQPEINVQGNAVSIADGDASPATADDTDFGLAYTSSAAVTYTIQNTDAGTLNISSITSSGTNSSEFVVSGAPSTVSGSGSETFTVTFTPTGAGTRTATITINSDDCDEAAYDFAVQGSGPAPGGISTGLGAWYKADEGVTGTSPVTAWADQSGNGLDLNDRDGTEPAYVSDGLNFNPVIDFPSNDKLRRTSVPSSSLRTETTVSVYGVFNTNSGRVVLEHGPDPFSTPSERFTLEYNRGGWDETFETPATSVVGTQHSIASWIVDTPNANWHINGDGGQTLGTSYSSAASATYTLTVGDWSSNTLGINGNIAEVIVFSQAHSNTDRNKVESYLAIKYGITLDQTSATNYVAADGGTVWNGTTNASYNNDIAGLGRDDASELDQRQSGSINSGAVVQLANGTHASPTAFSADDSWLIWGHDNGASTFGSGNINNGSSGTSNRMTRVWRVQETGTVGTVEVRISNSLASGTVSLVAHTSDATFPADGNRRVVEMTDDGTHYSASIDLADGEYFSFANANYATLTSQIVVINEVITDPQQDWGAGNFANPSPGGTGDADDEWIELLISTDDLDMSSWTIEMNDGTDESGSLAAGGAFNVSNYRSLTGGSLAKTKSGDYLILGDPSSGMMNSTGTLVVILKDASGGTIDQVTIATGSGTGFNSNASSTADESIARIPNGSDTDVDATDFAKTRASLGETSSPSGTVVINEVVNDPFSDWSTSSFDGTIGAGTVSAVDEWVELYIGTAGMNLTGWTIEMNDASPESGNLTAGGAFAVSNYVSNSGGTFINTQVGDYLVLGNPDGDLLLSNLTIILRDASSTIIDQIVIGGGTGEAPSGSNSAFESEAIARYPNATDTDTDDVDFIQTRPTLGSDNSPTGTVLINEVVTDPQQDWSTNGFDGTIAGGAVSEVDEWVELYIGTAGLNLTNWTIELTDGSNITGDLTSTGAFDVSNYISAGSGSFVNTEAGDYLVLGNPDGSGQMSNDIVITLKDASGNTVDEIELGDDVAGDGAGDGAPDGSANGGLATGISDEAIARIPNGTDTDNDVNDFAAVPASLGAMNSAAQLLGVGNSLVFDGTNDLVNLGSQILSSSAFTVEAWVNGSSFTNSGRFNRIMAINYGSYTSDNPFVLFVNSSGNIGYVFGTGDASTDQQVPLSFSPTLSTSTWYHVALTFDGSNKRLYVDGVLYGTINDTGTFTNTNSEPLLIGDFSTGTSDDGEWEGSIDEVRIWNDVRTHEEIVENMTGLLDPSTANLVSYYRFDQSSGTTLPDLTSSNNDGTLTNMVGTEWTAAGWDILAQNQAIFQSGGADVSTATSGELTLTDVSFLNDDNDLLLAGHDNGNFSEVTTDLPSGTLLTARYDRTWHLTKNDASGTSNGSVKLGFDLGAAPDVTYNYYLLERTGTSGDFAIVPAIGANPNGNSMEITVDASAIDDGSYYTIGRSDAGVGNALDLDGTDDFVSIADDNSLDFTSAFSLEAWVNLASTTGSRAIISKYYSGTSSETSYRLQVLDGAIRFQVNNSGATTVSTVDQSTGSISASTWHHIAAVANGSGNILVYMDGVQVGSSTYDNTVYVGTRDVLIGKARVEDAASITDGSIDEVRFWSDARSQQEILDNMFANLTGDEANLAAYYRFNQGIGDSNTSLPDLSPNGNNGTLTNFNNLGSATTSSNYIASTRTSIASSTTIINGGNLTATDGELTLTSTQTAGDFLQDANDYMRWNNDGGAFTETTTDVPSTTQVTTRYTKIWQIEKNDAIGTANGNVTFTFDLGAIPDPDYTYFLLSRSGTSGDFSIVEALGSSPSGNNISFVVDAGEVTDDYYFTLGRTDAGAGNALDFDGTDDYVDLGTSLNTLDDFTWEFWINFAGTSPQWFFAVTDGTVNERIQVEVNAGQVFFGLQSNANGQGWTSIGGGSISSNTWYHVAVTNSATTGKQIYVDGILVNSSSNTISPTELANNPSYAIGRLVNATDYYWDGQIDEVRIWSDVRTEQEIRDNMNRKLDVANESNLAAYYQFNTGIADGTNTGVDDLTDRSGNAISGTLTNFALSGSSSNWVASTATVADQSLATGLQGAGNALDLDGADEFVAIPDDASLETSSTLTVEAWVRPDVTTSFRGIAARYFTGGDASNVFALQINAGNYELLINESDNNLVTASTAATASTWTHVAGVADGTNVNIYIDGILMASTAYDGTITSNSSRGLFLGKYRTEDLFGTFDGLIDEVRIWNIARTGAEIQANMFESLTGSESGLVAYYKFDESSGTTLDDNSANSNTGTLNNTENADWVDASAREPFKTNGPGNLNTGATWVGGSAPGASQTLYVQHDLTVDANLTVDDFNLTAGNTLTLGSGQTLTVTGNLVNNGTITGDGKIAFTSGNSMISGGTFSNLEMNGGSPILCGETTITGILTMTSGNLQLDNYNLILNAGSSISGGGSSSYIQTIDNSRFGGFLQMEVGPSDGAVTYPIGSGTNYTPISFANLGTSASFAIRTFDGIYAYNTVGAAFTSNVISKTWDVNATGSGFNVTLTIQWNTADELTGFDRTNMYISTNDGDGWVERAGPLSATEISSGIYQASASGITSFSGVGGGNDVITPVTLLDFYALQIEEGVELVWHTAIEIDNEKFIIERSDDGLNFEAIDEVAGNGDSEEIIEYRYIDDNPLEGISYYRLKQVDFDGDFEYSPIVVAETEIQEREVVVYPNPFSDRLYIGLKEADTPAVIKLMSLSGQVVLQESVASANRFVQLNDLQVPPGVYILEIQQGEEVVRMRLVNE